MRVLVIPHLCQHLVFQSFHFLPSGGLIVVLVYILWWLMMLNTFLYIYEFRLFACNELIAYLWGHYSLGFQACVRYVSYGCFHLVCSFFIHSIMISNVKQKFLNLIKPSLSFFFLFLFIAFCVLRTLCLPSTSEWFILDFLLELL